jgi:hypothetical protein
MAISGAIDYAAVDKGYFSSRRIAVWIGQCTIRYPVRETYATLVKIITWSTGWSRIKLVDLITSLLKKEHYIKISIDNMVIMLYKLTIETPYCCHNYSAPSKKSPQLRPIGCGLGS